MASMFGGGDTPKVERDNIAPDGGDEARTAAANTRRRAGKSRGLNSTLLSNSERSPSGKMTSLG